MAVPRQPDSGAGRINQKRRTRSAIVDAAKELMRHGGVPTVAQAAEAALVSRTTAYRYFPTQESLLLEVAVNVDVDDCEALVAQPVDRGTSAERVLTLLALFNRHVRDEEVQYRTTLRFYLDQWLAAVAEGDDNPVVREGRRKRWFTELLAPFGDTVPAADLERLVAGLSMLAGAEALMVLRDVCHLDDDEAQAVTQWAARALIDATTT
jgi:AcrR family transcriptional regulator